MRRHRDLIRKLFLVIEADHLDYVCERIDTWTIWAVTEHGRLLRESGWMDVICLRDESTYAVTMLTAEGRDIWDVIWKTDRGLAKAAGIEGHLRATIEECEVPNEVIVTERGTQHHESRSKVLLSILRCCL